MKKSRWSIVFLTLILLATKLCAMEEITRPDVPTRLREAVDIPWKYLRFYMYSWDCYGSMGGGENGRSNTYGAIKTYSPALGDCIYSILYDPESQIEDIRLLLTIPRLAREANNTANGRSGGRLIMPAVYKEEAVNAYSRFIDTSFRSAFQVLKNKGQICQAFKVATIYGEKEGLVGNGWLDEIRDQATTEVENVARVVQALTPFPDLQAQERAKALAIIDAFPVGDARRAHIQSRYDAIVSAAVLAVPTVAALDFARRIADAI